MPDAITAARVGKVYDGGGGRVAALDGIDIRIAEGEFAAVLGPSGCGKSTLLNLVAGFEAPSEGAITVFGAPVTKPGPQRAVVFQEPALFPWLSVWENVVFAPKLAGRKRSEYADLAREFLRFLVSEEAQGVLPTTNWMYPAVTPAGGLPEGFEAIRQARTLLLDPEAAEAARPAAIEAWREALSR